MAHVVSAAVRMVVTLTIGQPTSRNAFGAARYFSDRLNEKPLGK
ncbi:MAG: hypothetical protein AAFR55_03190 [Pseudomonadota bacterium]